MLSLAACGRERGPLRPAADYRFASIAISSNHACGITSAGEAFCWGEASNGQLGHGAIEFTSEVVRVAGGHRWAQIAVSFSRSCGITTDGAAYCWGLNPTGVSAPGLKGLEESSRAVPVAVAPGMRFRQIATGMRQTCGLLLHGSVYCWGSGGAGAPVPGRGFSALAIGDFEACALAAGGTPVCWRPGAPPTAVGGTPPLVTIGAGGLTTCGVDADGVIYCWNPRQRQAERVAAGARFTAVAPGDARSCALDQSGRAWCWGRPLAGRVLPESAHAMAPRPVPFALTFEQLAAASARACGVETGGRLACWRQDHGLPMAPSEGARTVERWFLLWALGGAGLGLAFGLIAMVRPGTSTAAGVMGAIMSTLMGGLMGLVGAMVVGFFKVIEGLW